MMPVHSSRVFVRKTAASRSLRLGQSDGSNDYGTSSTLAPKTFDKVLVEGGLEGAHGHVTPSDVS
jgi:hypothetical protein